MGLFDELLSQPGVTATGGGTGYDPRDDEMEVRFTAEGTPYNARPGTPLHEGHTRANQPMFDLPTVEVPTEPSLLNYGYDQTVQPPQQVDVNPTQEYIDPMSLYNRQGRADYIPQNIVDTNTVFGSPSLGSLPNPTQDASAMEALNKASAERDKQAQIEAQLQVLLKAQGLDNRAEWDMRRADDQFANLDKQYDINNQVATDDFGNPLLNANEHGQTSYDINAIKQESLDNLMMQDRKPVANVATPPVVAPTDNKPDYPSNMTPYAINLLEEQRKRNEMFQGIGDTATGIYEGAKTLGSDIYDDVTGFDYKGLGSDIYKEGADAVQGAKDLYTDFNKPDTRTHRQRMIDNQTNVVEPVKEFITDTIPEFAGDAYEGILGPLVGNWYDNLSKDAEGPTQEYDSATGVQKPMVFNFKKSLATEVKGLVDAATSPVETADAIASVISGAVQHTLPDDMAWNEDSKKMAGAIGQMYAERYGSIDGFKKALAEDPVPVLIELTGAGLVSKVVAARTLASMKKIDMGEALEKFTDKAVETATMGMEKRGFRKELMVFHGSPHKFEKFDHKYMSSGEGGQMMGYGTYLAEHPSVAKTYAPRDMVMEDKLLKLYEDAMDFRRPGGEDVFAYEVYERALDHWTPKEISEYIKDTYKGDDLVKAEKALGNFKKMYEESDSYLYDIDLPDKTIAKMLDSDKTIMEQSDYVISALEDIYPNLSKEINNAKRIKQKLDKTTNKSERDVLFQEYADIKNRLGFNLDDNAHSLYRDLENTLGSDKKASKLLEDKGIPGVKFWDGDSRGSGEGTRNFVIFNENSAKVLKRNEVDIPNIDDGVLGQIGKATDPMKFDNADEFIKAQGTLVYHGGTKIDKISNISDDWGAFYMSDNPTYAKSFGGNKSVVNEMVLDKSANLVDMRKPSAKLVSEIKSRLKKDNAVFTDSRIVEGIKDGKAHFSELPEVKAILKELGYDGQITSEVPWAKNIGVWNKNVIQTKQQLTDTWNKAHKVDDGLLGQVDKTKNPTTDLRNSLREGGYKIDMDEGISGEIKLSRIEVPPNVRGKGLGTDAMNQIVKMADESGKTITLTPDTSFGATSVSRLKKFYKKFGFVENKGKNKDFLYKDSMLRLPNSPKVGKPNKVTDGLLGQTPVKGVHLTMEEFDDFKMGATRDSEPGIHFGTNSASGEKLIENKKFQIENNYIGKPRNPVNSPQGIKKIQADLNISKPLRVFEEQRMMGGRWDAHQIGRSLFEVDELPRRFTEADREAWYEGYLSSKVTIDGREVDVPLEVNKDGSTPDWNYSELDAKQESEWINNFLNERGYDHIIYDNAYEGGGDSLGVYDLSKIKQTGAERYATLAIPTGGLLGTQEETQAEETKGGILNNVKSWKPNNNLTTFVKTMENDPLRVGNAKVKEYDDVGHKAKGYGTKSGLLAQDTEAEATKALNKKLVDANKAVDRLVKIDLNEDQRNALVSLVYNVGATGFGKSNALKALNNGNIKTFLKEAFDPKVGFVKTKGKIVKGLVNRRAREKQIFTKGNYGN